MTHRMRACRPGCCLLPDCSGVQVSDLPSRELVPGDLVELHVGDKVPADVRMITLKTATLRSEQASLTGESVAVLKATDQVHEEDCELQVCPKTLRRHAANSMSGSKALWYTLQAARRFSVALCINQLGGGPALHFASTTWEDLSPSLHLLTPGYALQSQECMLFAGTSISNGSCVGIVNDIGMSTQIGKIQAQIQAAEGEEDDSPLKKKLDEFGELLAKVCGRCSRLGMDLSFLVAGSLVSVQL